MLLAALAGLFAMHGISDHGTMRHGSTDIHASDSAGPHAAMTTGTAATTGVHAGDLAGDHAGVLAHVSTATTATTTVAAFVTDSTVGAIDSSFAADVTESSDLYAAMGLCLAILAGAVFLSLRRAGLSSYPLSSVLATDIGRRLLPSRARAPDPPDLHALSIQRC